MHRRHPLNKIQNKIKTFPKKSISQDEESILANLILADTKIGKDIRQFIVNIISDFLCIVWKCEAEVFPLHVNENLIKPVVNLIHKYAENDITKQSLIPFIRKILSYFCEFDNSHLMYESLYMALWKPEYLNKHELWAEFLNNHSPETEKFKYRAKFNLYSLLASNFVVLEKAIDSLNLTPYKQMTLFKKSKDKQLKFFSEYTDDFINPQEFLKIEEQEKKAQSFNIIASVAMKITKYLLPLLLASMWCMAIDLSLRLIVSMAVSVFLISFVSSIILIKTINMKNIGQYYRKNFRLEEQTDNYVLNLLLKSVKHHLKSLLSNEQEKLSGTRFFTVVKTPTLKLDHDSSAPTSEIESVTIQHIDPANDTQMLTLPRNPKQKTRNNSSSLQMVKGLIKKENKEVKHDPYDIKKTITWVIDEETYKYKYRPNELKLYDKSRVYQIKDKDAAHQSKWRNHFIFYDYLKLCKHLKEPAHQRKFSATMIRAEIAGPVNEQGLVPYNDSVKCKTLGKNCSHLRFNFSRSTVTGHISNQTEDVSENNKYYLHFLHKVTND